MAIDAIALSLSGNSFPVTTESVTTLTAQAVTTLAGSPTNATRVEFELLHTPLTSAAGQGALKAVKASTSDDSASPTGTYSVNFAAELLQEPGLYQVRAKGIVAVTPPSGTETINTMVVAESDDLLVIEAAPQTLDDVKAVLAEHSAELADHEGRIMDLENAPAPSPPPGP